MAVQSRINLRPAASADLPAINAIIEAAVMGWQLPERVKRLALSSYRYTPDDLSHLDIIVAELDHSLVGVAACEEADKADLPDASQGLLLHGLYVHPDSQHQGIGSRLLQAIEQQVVRRHLDGLLVKAQSSAIGFFEAQGLTPLPSNDPERDYQHRYWKFVAQINT
jgi:N-acetylglutamate synthase-like GNAT family acetyltransferase